MLDYDFGILQPSEFECFSRDLLQAREEIFIESFANGRDKGIDLRFAYSKDKTCIVQCKRYKEWKELKGKLKDELEKVKRLTPQRYIITTSVDLTVGQKDEVATLFTPYIIATTDILGRKDLNNLLEQHPDIEKNYHKLWLASTNVLNTIINSATLNWSSFELEKVENDIRLYVENESLNKALGILKENHYVVISGIPGIGKTTLARMLVYTMLAQNYEEFVYVTDGMDDVAKMFNKEKSQIFFYDDFLGSTSFTQQSVGFENKLITFIEKVRKSKTTLFILSTREYVLSEAKAHYEKLAMSNIDIAKCTIELEYYTKTIKARILYNHLSEANIPQKFMNAFLDKRAYRSIINHKNFNPRVIESIINDRIWETVDVAHFASKVEEFFDNPFSVWQFAFEKLDIDTRYALLVMGTMENKVRLVDFQEAYKNFCMLTNKDIGVTYDDVKWRKSLKVLTNCFVKPESQNDINFVKMYNSSIADFIVFYLRQNNETASLMIKGAFYIEQLYEVFTDNENFALKNNCIFLDKKSFPLIKESFERIWNATNTCHLKDRFFGDVEKDYFNDTRILYNFKKKYPLFCKENVGFVEKIYDTDGLTWQTVKLDYRTGLMKMLDWNLMYDSANRYITTIVEDEVLNTDEWIEIAETVKSVSAEDVVDDFFYRRLDEDLKQEIEQFSDQSECDDEFNKLESLKELLPDWNWYNVFGEIDYAEERIKKNEENEPELDTDYSKWHAQFEKEDAQIDEMFETLRIS